LHDLPPGYRRRKPGLSPIRLVLKCERTPVNYAKRYRADERVGTSITEGTANFLVNPRMNKTQQMR
jgi:hypothetical protein